LGLHKPRYASALENASAIIAVGENTANQFPNNIRSKIHVIPNGIDLTRYRTAQVKPNMNILFVGRMDQVKKRALERIKRLWKNADSNRSSLPKIVIVGDTGQNSATPGNLGWKPDLAPVLSRANLVIASGRTAREAMACGCAVLLLNRKYDGIIAPELVTKSGFNFSGSNGYFRFSQIKGDLLGLINDEEKLKSLQEFGQTYAAEHFSLTTMTTQICALYQIVHQNFDYRKALYKKWLRQLNIGCWGHNA